MTAFDKAFIQVQTLVQKFDRDIKHYMSAGYSEAEARQDFIDNFFIALGWDVNHQTQTNPYEQEVKIERSQKQQNESARKRADYAFYFAPNFKDEIFFVEAKKPSVLITRNEQHYFQTIRYGWNAGCPISVLTDFEEFVIVDCRAKPNIKYALNGQHKSFKYTDYANKEKFAEIYWLFSREAVANKSIEKYVVTLGKAKGRVTQKALFKGGYQTIDDSFLEYIDGIRLSLAQAFKKNDDTLDGEQLTEAVQRTVDRLVFIRFLEDKFIEAESHVNEWTGWKDFIADCRKLDAKYNGVVFKKHFIDEQHFVGAEETLFKEICQDISSLNSPYDFNYIPIHILGSIYERFLGKVIRTTAKRVFVEEKPEVRKAGGVYYTPKYIVDYIVQNTVGKQIEGKTPKQIADLHFADIACGSGSFLIGVYDCLLDYHRNYYNKLLDEKTTAKILQDIKFKNKKGAILEDNGNVEYRDGQWCLTLKLKQNILLNNIYGVDIDYQAVEVTQLSLFLKMLEDETLSSTSAFTAFSKVLPDLTKNIVCGNSLIGYDIMNMNGGLFEDDEMKKLNPMDYAAAFPKIMRSGGFDGIVGNPPYLSTKGIDEISKNYYIAKYEVAIGQFDLYGLFIEKIVRILKTDGVLGYITSNTFFSNKDFLSLRKLLLDKTTIQELLNFGETVFKDANLDVSILILKKQSPPKKASIKIALSSNDFFNNQFHYTQQTFFNDENNNYELQISITEKDASILSKIFAHKNQLGDFLALPRGIELGSNSEKIINEYQQGYRKLLVGKNIKKYQIDFNNTFIQFENNKSIFKEECIYNSDKILIQRIRNLSLKTRIVATLDTEKYLAMNTLRFGIAKENFIDLKCLLGLLNSKLINFLFLKSFFNKDIYAYQLERIPIPFSCSKQSFEANTIKEIVNCVTQLLAAKQKLAQAKEGRDKEFITNQCNALNTNR
jgi:adenine-specific DNA-methyltransferase